MTSNETARAGFVLFVVTAADAAAAEAALADAFEAGASGLEERDDADGKGAPTCLLYARAADAAAVAVALARHPGVDCSAAAPVPARDWSEKWKEGLAAVVVSPRLCVRPSFAQAPARPGQAELLIDPGQAFGTGGHQSTRLALAWVAELAPSLPGRARALDVGCGTGVLALAALLLGAERAVALDLDPLAAAAARENARSNGLAGRLDVLLGPLDAVRAGGFELVAANLLRTELLPLLGGIARQVAAGGRVVLSGLLEPEVAGVEAACAEVGLRGLDRRGELDANGDRWVALLMTR